MHQLTKHIHMHQVMTPTVQQVSLQLKLNLYVECVNEVIKSTCIIMHIILTDTDRRHC